MSNLDFMGRIAEGKIQEAIEEGKFDNLPGKGQPIVFDDDPMTPPHLRVLNRILKNANVLPEWIQIQRDLDLERKQIRDMRLRLIRENDRWAQRLAQMPRHTAAMREYTTWHTASRAAYLRMLKGINASILKFTLAAPSTAAPLRSYKIDAEMEALDMDFPTHAHGGNPS